MSATIKQYGFIRGSHGGRMSDDHDLIPLSERPYVLHADHLAAMNEVMERLEELESKLLDKKKDPIIIGASRVIRIAECKACNGTGRRPIGGRGKIFGLTNRCFECQPMTEEECQ